MSETLRKGGNLSLSKKAPGATAVRVGLGWQVGSGGYDLDASALMCDGSGQVVSDQHFVFFNNLASPDDSVRHTGAASSPDSEQVLVDLERVPATVEKIVFTVAIYEARQRGQHFGQVRAAHIRVVDDGTGAELARYDLDADAGATETAMVFGELYRHGADWKFRAVGQGYVAGLAGIARDYGVSVLQEATPAPLPAPAAVPSAPPVVRVAPAAFDSNRKVSTAKAAVPHSPGSSSMTCFFDANHGAGVATVLWYPQWGVPRQIQACGGCAQRVQTTQPPFYPPAQQQDYPPAGYPQQGYPQQQGYQQQAPQHDYGYQPDHGQGGGRRFGTGAMIGAGAAGLVGGVLLNEALGDDD
ncbi:TerD family protein [Kitasatospora sp. NPDC050463]|uniref:TerD family protein n=1 Tax=Kitasatospora sp. NPDC050463 TaxID=3155786 RepID=UPI0033D784DF